MLSPATRTIPAADLAGCCHVDRASVNRFPIDGCDVVWAGQQQATIDRAVKTNEAVLTELLGASPVSRRRAARGYTPAERWIVQLDDGRSVFIKAATNDLTAGWLRDEYRMYEALRAPFMPALLGWRDGDRPILVLEDLSGGFWPPPWTDDRVASVLRMMKAVAATPPPSWLVPVKSSGFLERGWDFVRDDPVPLVGTGLVSTSWLEASLPTLIEASDACQIDGPNLLHLDVRSDNICFRADGSSVLVDWNLAVIGNPRIDIAFWLPTLVAEDGPEPRAVLPDAGPEAAVVSGFFAARAGLPPIPGAPAIRPLQLEQLRHALPWVCRELDLAQPAVVNTP